MSFSRNNICWQFGSLRTESSIFFRTLVLLAQAQRIIMYITLIILKAFGMWSSQWNYGISNLGNVVTKVREKC